MAIFMPKIYFGQVCNYANGDHLAFKISTSTFESKWGVWPKYQHAPGDCPYNSTGLQYYYIPISGDDVICNSEGYFTLNISGATYDWSGSKVSSGIPESGFESDHDNTNFAGCQCCSTYK